MILMSCNRHERRGTWHSVSTKAWRDGGGGRGFGYVKIKRKMLRCSENSETKPNKSPARVNLLTTWLQRKSPTNGNRDNKLNLEDGKNDVLIGDNANLLLSLTNQKKE